MHILAQAIGKRSRRRGPPLLTRISSSFCSSCHRGRFLICQLAPASSSWQRASPFLQPGDHRDDAAASRAGYTVRQLGTSAAQMQPFLIPLHVDSSLRSKCRGLQNALHLRLCYLVIVPAGFACIVRHETSYAFGASFSVVTDIAGSVAWSLPPSRLQASNVFGATLFG